MNEKLRGITPRIITSIFDTINNTEGHIMFMVKISMIEVYMEDLRDLLNPNGSAKLAIREHPTDGVYIDEAVEKSVIEALEVETVLAAGNANRKVGRTNMNEVSSRSHSMTIFTIQQNNTNDHRVLKGKMYLVDLAGSEKMEKTGATGERLEEAKLINKGLLNLGSVINALTEGQSHIPYRNSKLTRILQNSLGGNSKTTLIVTCSPSIYNEAETISTLRFGVRAKLIKNKPVINEELSRDQLVKNLDAAQRRIRLLEAYSQFLEEHIVNTLKQPLPRFNFNEDEDFDRRRTASNNGAANQVAGSNLNFGSSSAQMTAATSTEVAGLKQNLTKMQQDNEEFKRKIDEHLNTIANSDTKLKISKEQNNILTGKLNTLVNNMKMMDQFKNDLQDKILELEGANRELLSVIDNLETSQRTHGDISNMSAILNQNLENLELQTKDDFENFIDNLVISGKEKEIILKFSQVKLNELESAASKVKKFRVVVKDLLANYQKLIEQEMPQLEVDHKIIVTELKKAEKRNNFMFNDKLMNVIHNYVDKNEQLEKLLVQKEDVIKHMNEESKNDQVKYRQKIQSLKHKIDILRKCVNICTKKLEDYRTMRMQDNQVRKEIKLNELDVYCSNFQTGDRATWAGEDMSSGNKVIKLIRGSDLIREENKEGDSGGGRRLSKQPTIADLLSKIFLGTFLKRILIFFSL